MATAAITGTVGDGATEAEIVSGGGTIIITLAGDTWIAGGGVASHIQGDSVNAASGNLTINLTVTAGNLIVAYVAWGNADTVTVSDGTTSFTAGTMAESGGGGYGQFFYLLSANGGAKTYTATLASGTQSIMFVSEFNTTSGTWSYDASNQGGNLDTTACSTGNITTTGTTEVVVYGNKLFNHAASASDVAIGGVAPTEPAYSPEDTYHHFYYRLPTSTFTGDGHLTYSATTDWVANIMAFKAQ